jgi:hypothetical protein
MLYALILVTWTAPATYVDGSALEAGALEGYRLLWSVRGEIQPEVAVPAGATSFDLGDHKGRVCVSLVAIAHGVESDPSAIACKAVKPARVETIEVQQ